MDEKNFKTAQTKGEADVITFYEEYADSWDKRYPPALSTKSFLNSRWECFRKVLADNGNGATALELGVGTGVYIDRASKIFKIIYAVDGSQTMISCLKKKLTEKAIDNVIPMQSNVISMQDIKDNSIDIVYFFGLIEHIVNLEAFLKEMKRVLHIGGYVVGVTPNPICPWYLVRKFYWGTGKHCSTDRFFTRTQLTKIFEDHGFLLEQCEYWGGMPAGINNPVIYNFLHFFEKFLERTFLSKYLAGMAFRFKLTR